jgi:hypothetical protein
VWTVLLFEVDERWVFLNKREKGQWIGCREQRHGEKKKKRQPSMNDRTSLLELHYYGLTLRRESTRKFLYWAMMVPGPSMGACIVPRMLVYHICYEVFGMNVGSCKPVHVLRWCYLGSGAAGPSGPDWRFDWGFGWWDVELMLVWS